MENANPAKATCVALPKEAFNFLKKLANRDLTNIQETTDKIHNCFTKLEENKINSEAFNRDIQNHLNEIYNYLQDLNLLNFTFPTLFSDDQATILSDLTQLTREISRAFPSYENFSEYENGQIGGAVTILQQQWVA
ncbi:MAG: hypothetical protein A2Y28_00905 [Chlamydiae bacterium GWC2_50_10]|nr:MAG: hypothetical protein A2Z85_01140 [Chlamydiae bacterium GWA2_50_15]OGN53782.1 MAG: hypothetical protein A2Y28_00905 [Chlamydiae bacterium GWC2_50_10]OGN57767.1 MAG: hypothetical protein A3D18_04895 [Chlamydiae bacterium RIFCSPHIGHO2_02_FULL_49_29]OGN63443.1 MAG: hypothetical protein A3E26_01360 [Chlamydiae bacterium RIFCSPHIGHO2_12_FULL_49_32]OGN68242.1 MAG: hypothetical protein A3I15_05180 [Chlamydiae bacterium RIFCSPLOWO2_02_FULL_49_12]OGN72863.1 MAG: hypothetical protein A3G30_01615 